MSQQPSSKLPPSRGGAILKKLLQRARDDEYGGTGYFDTYRSLKQLKEMLKGGQITENEYEAIKIELLTH